MHINVFIKIKGKINVHFITITANIILFSHFRKKYILEEKYIFSFKVQSHRVLKGKRYLHINVFIKIKGKYIMWR